MYTISFAQDDLFSFEFT